MSNPKLQLLTDGKLLFKNGKIMLECCCNCTDCCCDATKPYYMQPCLTLKIEDVITAVDAPPALNCLRGWWGLPFIEHNDVAQYCVWRNRFYLNPYPGDHSRTTIVTMEARVGTTVDGEPRADSCIQLYIEIDGCDDCNAQPMMTNPPNGPNTDIYSTTTQNCDVIGQVYTGKDAGNVVPDIGGGDGGCPEGLISFRVGGRQEDTNHPVSLLQLSRDEFIVTVNGTITRADRLIATANFDETHPLHGVNLVEYYGIEAGDTVHYISDLPSGVPSSGTVTVIGFDTVTSGKHEGLPIVLLSNSVPVGNNQNYRPIPLQVRYSRCVDPYLEDATGCDCDIHCWDNHEYGGSLKVLKVRVAENDDNPPLAPEWSDIVSSINDCLKGAYLFNKGESACTYDAVASEPIFSTVRHFRVPITNEYLCDIAVDVTDKVLDCINAYVPPGVDVDYSDVIGAACGSLELPEWSHLVSITLGDYTYSLEALIKWVPERRDSCEYLTRVRSPETLCAEDPEDPECATISCGDVLNDGHPITNVKFALHPEGFVDEETLELDPGELECPPDSHCPCGCFTVNPILELIEQNGEVGDYSFPPGAYRDVIHVIRGVEYRVTYVYDGGKTWSPLWQLPAIHVCDCPVSCSEEFFLEELVSEILEYGAVEGCATNNSNWLEDIYDALIWIDMPVRFWDTAESDECCGDYIEAIPCSYDTEPQITDCSGPTPVYVSCKTLAGSEYNDDDEIVFEWESSCYRVTASSERIRKEDLPGDAAVASTGVTLKDTCESCCDVVPDECTTVTVRDYPDDGDGNPSCCWSLREAKLDSSLSLSFCNETTTIGDDVLEFFYNHFKDIVGVAVCTGHNPSSPVFLASMWSVPVDMEIYEDDAHPSGITRYAGVCQVDLVHPVPSTGRSITPHWQVTIYNADNGDMLGLMYLGEVSPSPDCSSSDFESTCCNLWSGDSNRFFHAHIAYNDEDQYVLNTSVNIEGSFEVENNKCCHCDNGNCYYDRDLADDCLTPQNVEDYVDMPFSLYSTGPCTCCDCTEECYFPLTISSSVDISLTYIEGGSDSDGGCNSNKVVRELSGSIDKVSVCRWEGELELHKEIYDELGECLLEETDEDVPVTVFYSGTSWKLYVDGLELDLVEDQGNCEPFEGPNTPSEWEADDGYTSDCYGVSLSGSCCGCGDDVEYIKATPCEVPSSASSFRCPAGADVLYVRADSVTGLHHIQWQGAGYTVSENDPKVPVSSIGSNGVLVSGFTTVGNCLVDVCEDLPSGCTSRSMSGHSCCLDLRQPDTTMDFSVSRSGVGTSNTHLITNPALRYFVENLPPGTGTGTPINTNLWGITPPVESYTEEYDPDDPGCNTYVAIYNYVLDAGLGEITINTSILDKYTGSVVGSIVFTQLGSGYGESCCFSWRIASANFSVMGSMGSDSIPAGVTATLTGSIKVNNNSCCQCEGNNCRSGIPDDDCIPPQRVYDYYFTDPTHEGSVGVCECCQCPSNNCAYDPANDLNLSVSGLFREYFGNDTVPSPICSGNPTAYATEYQVSGATLERTGCSTWSAFNVPGVRRTRDGNGNVNDTSNISLSVSAARTGPGWEVSFLGGGMNESAQVRSDLVSMGNTCPYSWSTVGSPTVNCGTGNRGAKCCDCREIIDPCICNVSMNPNDWIGTQVRVRCHTHDWFGSTTYSNNILNGCSGIHGNLDDLEHKGAYEISALDGTYRFLSIDNNFISFSRVSSTAYRPWEQHMPEPPSCVSFNQIVSGTPSTHRFSYGSTDYAVLRWSFSACRWELLLSFDPDEDNFEEYEVFRYQVPFGIRSEEGPGPMHCLEQNTDYNVVPCTGGNADGVWQWSYAEMFGGSSYFWDYEQVCTSSRFDFTPSVPIL